MTKDQTSTTDFYSTDVADIRFFSQVEFMLASVSGFEKYACNSFRKTIVALLTSREDIHVIIVPVRYPIRLTCV